MIFKEYVCPSTLAEAYETLRSHPGSVLLGGCTLLRRNTRTSPLGIDLGGLGLNQITKTGTDLILGASVSLREMETSCGDLFDGALCRAVSSLGDPSAKCDHGGRNGREPFRHKRPPYGPACAGYAAAILSQRPVHAGGVFEHAAPP